MICPKCGKRVLDEEQYEHGLWHLSREKKLRNNESVNEFQSILKEITDNLRGAVSYPFAPSVKLGLKAKYELCLKNVLNEATRIEAFSIALAEIKQE